MHMVIHQYILASVLLLFSTTLCAHQSHSSTTSIVDPNEETALLELVDPASSHGTHDESDASSNELLDWKKPLAIGVGFALGTFSYQYGVSKCAGYSACQYLQAVGRAALPATVVIIFSATVLATVSLFKHCVHKCRNRNNTSHLCSNIPLLPPPV